MKTLLALSERQFQQNITELARLLGWCVYSIPDSRRCTSSGFPDLILMHPRRARLLARELKTDGGRVSAEQTVWLAGMRCAGIDAEVWRPSMWEKIVKELQGGTVALSERL